MLISFEISKRMDDIHLDDFKWLKPEILTKAEKFSNEDYDDSLEG